jgi:arsenite oxidase small subunit
MEEANTPCPVAAECPFRKWREDFPIDWDNDHYITRRDLAKFLTLGSGLLAGAGALMAAAGYARKGEHTGELKIGSASQVAAGGSMLFRYPTDGDPCILVRDEAGELHAFSQVCTHLSCAVVHHPEEKALFCPCHHGYFSDETGVPYAGPPTRRLPRIRLEVRGDEIYAVGVEV